MSAYVTSEGSALEMMVKDEEPPFGEKGSLALLGGECLAGHTWEGRQKSNIGEELGIILRLLCMSVFC